MELIQRPNINDLLNKEIVSLFIGFKKLKYTDIIHILDDSFIGYKFFLPTFPLGGRYCFHAKAFFKLINENNYGILTDYGGKADEFLPNPNNINNNDIYRFYFKYGNSGGLRYKISNLTEFKNGCDNFMKLNIRETMPITINQLLNQICSQSSWTKRDYNVALHNCQDFIKEIIKILKAERKIENKRDGRGFHNYSICHFPPIIIEELEKNENDTNLGFNKTPIIGQIDEGIRMIIDNINYYYN